MGVIECNDNEEGFSNGVIFLLTACAVVPVGAVLGAMYIVNSFNASGVKGLEDALPSALLDLVRNEKKKKKKVVGKKGGKKGKKAASGSDSDSSSSDSDSD